MTSDLALKFAASSVQYFERSLELYESCREDEVVKELAKRLHLVLVPVFPPAAIVLQGLSALIDRAEKTAILRKEARQLQERHGLLQILLTQVESHKPLNVLCGMYLESMKGEVMTLGSHLNTLLCADQENFWLYHYFKSLLLQDRFKKSLADWSSRISLIREKVSNLVMIYLVVRDGNKAPDVMLPPTVESPTSSDSSPVKTPSRKGIKIPTTILDFCYIGDFKGLNTLVANLGRSAREESNKAGNTYYPVHQATFWSDIQGLCILISAGADVNALTRQDCSETGLSKASSCLHIAAKNNDARLVKLLLFAGCDPKQPNERGELAFHVTTSEECRLLVKDAEQHKSIREYLRIQARSGKGKEMLSDMLRLEFPLELPIGGMFGLIHYAAYNGEEELYEQLVEYGVNPLLLGGGKLASVIARGGKHSQFCLTAKEREDSRRQ